MRRREFLKTSAASGTFLLLPSLPLPTFSREESDISRLAEAALSMASSLKASYADIRIADYRNQSVSTRERRVTGLSNSESSGFGVRVIVNGTWGFAASSVRTVDEVHKVTRQAVDIARTNSRLQKEPVQLAPVKAIIGTWTTPDVKDPFLVPIGDKTSFLLHLNEQALNVKGVSFCTSFMAFVREHKYFASTEGSFIEQTLYRCYPSFTVTSVDRERGSFQSRNSYSEPQGMGYEYVERYPWEKDIRQAAEDVLEKHTARSVQPGPQDLILHPSNLWLTIHESVGHPTELDRAIGMEANYAGTSFLTTDKRGSFKFGSDLVNLVADKTHPNALATCGYDDEGVPAKQWHLIRNGVFVDYQTTREQAHILGHKESYGCSYAQSWADVPFQRMPNVSLEPGKTPLSLSQLIGDTEDAIMIKGRGSYSIDHQRYNFQFGGQTYYEIKNGKIAGMLKDVAYQARTPDFWNSCDAICSRDEYMLGGSFNDGKGEPGQSNAVSHGCSPARFRNINILNTGKS
ncbi:MAG: TldD/PmbA family protein [Bacteroidota bacterium]